MLFIYTICFAKLRKIKKLKTAPAGEFSGGAVGEI